MTKDAAPAITGLLVAWGGTALLVSPVAKSLTGSLSVVTAVLGQLALWALCLVVIGIVTLWEKQPLASLWLKPLQWQSLAWAGALIVITLSLFPVTEWIRNAAGLPGYASGMETALAYPAWLRILAAVTAGIVEETMFRGFAVTRLLQLSGNTLVAIGLSSAVFGALHLPLWGTGPSLAFFLGSLAATAFFVWRRDLLAMIIAHAAVDVWGLAMTPALSRWWN